MAKIEREYYSINEASEIICCSVADLVHLATKGEVKFIVLTSGLQAQRIRQNIIEEKQPYEYIEDKFCYVSQDNVAVFEANHSNDDLYITWVYTDDDLEHGWGLHPSSLIPATNDSLYMLTTDIDVLMDGVAIVSPALINANASRTLHIMEWLERNKYNAGKNNIWLDGELRKDNPDLWGKNMETFNKWKQTTEAEPAMELLKKLKLEARKAD